MLIRFATVAATGAMVLAGCSDASQATEPKAEIAMGQWVECNGTVGTIEGTAPGDAPAYIIQVWAQPTPYQLTCATDKVRVVPEPGTNAPAQTTPAQTLPVQAAVTATPMPAPPAAAISPLAGIGDQCVPGAKLEGLYGNSWYAVTVRAGPDKNGWCPVSYDGYDAFWDGAVPELRPRGSGEIISPVKPVAEQQTKTGGKVPDGRYSCSKIVGGGGEFRHMGMFNIRGGRVTGSPFPDGWVVQSVTATSNTQQGKPIVEILYRTTSGNTDVLDCTRE